MFVQSLKFRVRATNKELSPENSLDESRHDVLSQALYTSVRDRRYVFAKSLHPKPESVFSR